ncbi:hypothetical protein [Nereida sp. MMG025]|uniref:hypothetical protein n=1 Tax=Nereida sp. MMG025 TaxID=2909981 RepID=UPI001F34403F|nr:hypothetical protein [Nereida sp. MMG025]
MPLHSFRLPPPCLAARQSKVLPTVFDCADICRMAVVMGETLRGVARLSRFPHAFRASAERQKTVIGQIQNGVISL